MKTETQLLFLSALLLTCGLARSANLTPSELALQQQLGPGTPDPTPLWPAKPPQFLAPAEFIVDGAKIRSVTAPTITPYLPPKEKRNGMAVIVCAGGGYGSLDWKTHVKYAADVFLPRGVAIIGLFHGLARPRDYCQGARRHPPTADAAAAGDHTAALAAVGAALRQSAARIPRGWKAIAPGLAVVCRAAASARSARLPARTPLPSTAGARE